MLEAILSSYVASLFSILLGKKTFMTRMIEDSLVASQFKEIQSNTNSFEDEEKKKNEKYKR